MQGVVGGVNARTLEAGGVPNPNPDLLSASTTLLQSGGGAYARLVNALQGLDQSANIITLANQAVNFGSDIATLQGQVATLQGQVSTLQAQVAAQQVTINSMSYNQVEVSTGTLFLDQRTIYKRSFVINNALVTPLTNFTYPHGVAAINYIVNIQAMAAQAGGQQLPLTFVNLATAPNISIGLSIWADVTNLYISVANTAFPGYQVLATLWYTATNR